MGPWAVRGSITALLVLGLVLAESFAWAGNRWGTVALGGGLALALVLRWRRPAVWGAAVGLALGQFAIYTPPALAVTSTLAMLLAISLGVRVLQRLGFDSHLRRTPDLVHLVLVVLILAAPVASLPLLRCAVPTCATRWKWISLSQPMARASV